ncbi:MAG: hypothetical protein JWN66_5008 [Sphingomonas bacterium]|jgi:hypothetical protein|uniref:hypothetical protein n=1 Tax=Sphingomonas bacterium TaxID=1895847 RepID=UPI00262C5D27|nr:hypothetical protein [Sphingomonas bacterium]MDB5707892.1 hypothetical protein [Sphingomonas bacterium]
MSATIYLTTILLPLGTILIVFGMKYWSAAVQARTSTASEEAYRALAEKSVAAEAANAASLASIKAELSTVAVSLAAVEKILKQVE